MKQNVRQLKADLEQQLDELQKWFAARPYGFREHATAEQLRQFEDQEREQHRIVELLAQLQ